MTPYLLHLQSLKNGTTVAPKKKSKGIVKKSEKRKKDEKEYHKILDELRAISDRCELKVPGVCIGVMQGGHHKKKRTPKTYLDKKLILRSCNHCNSWAEAHSAEAKEMGLVESKFN